MCGNSVGEPTNAILPPTNAILPPTNAILPPTNAILPPTNAISPMRSAVLLSGGCCVSTRPYELVHSNLDAASQPSCRTHRCAVWVPIAHGILRRCRAPPRQPAPSSRSPAGLPSSSRSRCNIPCSRVGRSKHCQWHRAILTRPWLRRCCSSSSEARCPRVRRPWIRIRIIHALRFLPIFCSCRLIADRGSFSAAAVAVGGSILASPERGRRVSGPATPRGPSPFQAVSAGKTREDTHTELA